MADIVDRNRNLDEKYRDQGDGSYAPSKAALGYGWDTTSGSWVKLTADHATGALNVAIVAGAAAGGTSSSFGAAFPATGTAAGFTDGTNMQGGRVFDVDSGAGTQYVQGVNLRASASGGSVEIPAPAPADGAANPAAALQSGALTSIFDGTNWQRTRQVQGDASTAVGVGSTAGLLFNGTTWDRPRGDATNGAFVNVKTGTLTANIGTTNGLALDATLTGGTQKTKIVDSGGTNVATVSAAGAVKVDGSAVTQPVSGTVTANQGGAPWTSALVAQTSGSNLSTNSIVSAATTNATSVKASAGQVYGYAVFNNGAGVAYFKLYNKASAPTVGTDTPFMRIMIPAGGGANVFTPIGVPMGTGIAYAITGGAADSDTTAVALSQVLVNLFYD